MSASEFFAKLLNWLVIKPITFLLDIPFFMFNFTFGDVLLGMIFIGIAIEFYRKLVKK